MTAYRTPWTLSVDGNGVHIHDADRNLIRAIENDEGEDQIALWSRIVDAVNVRNKVKELVDLYFEPWGAAKSAQWESLTGGAPFDPERALRVIQGFLR